MTELNGVEHKKTELDGMEHSNCTERTELNGQAVKIGQKDQTSLLKHKTHRSHSYYLR